MDGNYQASNNTMGVTMSQDKLTDASCGPTGARASSSVWCAVLAVVVAMSAGCAVSMYDEEPATEESIATSAVTRARPCGGYNEQACRTPANGYSCRKPLEARDSGSVMLCLCPGAQRWVGGDLKCLSSNCLSEEKKESALVALGKSSDVGSITEEAVDNLLQGSTSGVAGNQIEKEVWVFRTTGFPKEIRHMERHLETLAKAFFRTPDWDLHGPSANSANALALRLLALSSSDSPKSQFSSVALTFGVAASFATSGQYVYAMKMVPNSRIFGIKDCEANDWSKGEIQMQPINRTKIIGLRRKLAAAVRGQPTPVWEYLKTPSTDSSAAVWATSKCNENLPRNCPEKDVKDEL
jgi:hypothetical protein